MKYNEVDDKLDVVEVLFVFSLKKKEHSSSKNGNLKVIHMRNSNTFRYCVTMKRAGKSLMRQQAA